MTPEQAEKIIDSYVAAILKIKEKNMVQPLSDLPCSPGKIRYAHFVYAESLIREGRLTEEIGGALEHSYGILNSSFVEDADKINEAFKQYENNDDPKKKKEAGKIINNYGLSLFSLPEMKTELHNFFVDCSGNYNPNKL